MSKSAILRHHPSLTPTGGSGANLTCFLDSPHMVSYYLPIHFMALNAILKKIMGGGGVHMNFKISGWYL